MPKAANRSAGAARRASRAWFISNLATARRLSTTRITASSWRKAFVGRQSADRYAMYRSERPPNFTSFAAAARAGNPNSALAFNPGVVDRLLLVSPHEDYTAGEEGCGQRIEKSARTANIPANVSLAVRHANQDGL